MKTMVKFVGEGGRDVKSTSAGFCDPAPTTAPSAEDCCELFVVMMTHSFSHQGSTLLTFLVSPTYLPLTIPG
jgi:hypothetical protein